MTLSKADRDLLNLKVNTRPDLVLAQLMSDAASNIDRTIGLLTNGMTIYGRLSSFEVMAAALDENSARRYEMGLRTHRESWSKIDRELFTGRFTRQNEREERERSEYFDRVADIDFDDQSEADQREYINDRETVLTIADATVFPPGAPHFTVPVMRVPIGAVNGWWLVPIDEDGQARISHPDRAAS